MKIKLKNSAFRNFLKFTNGTVCFVLFCILHLQSSAQIKDIQISNVDVRSGSVGTTISITGSNFTNASEVYFGTIRAKTAWINSTQLNAEVPQGASFEQISVITPGVSNVASSFYFTVNTKSPCGFTKPLFDTEDILSTDLKISQIALEDVNKDGFEDLLILESNSNLYIYLNQSSSGKFSFEKYDVIKLNGRVPANIAISDLDSDGYMDAVIGYNAGNQISILHGLSEGGFDPNLTNMTVGLTPKFVRTGDLNKDGKLEIVVGNVKAESISILNLVPIKENLLNYTVTNTITNVRVTDLAIGDVDADGNKDIITADGTQGNYYSIKDFYKNAQVIAGSDGTDLIQGGNFNMDGNEDIILGNSGGISVNLNGKPQPCNNDLYSSVNASALTASDFNSDGKPDVAALVSDGKFNHINFFLADGSGAFKFTKTEVSTEIAGNVNLLSGDIDGDGQADLVTYNVEKGAIYMYRKSSEVFLSPQGALVCPNSPATLSAQANEGIISWIVDGKPVTGNTITIPANLIGTTPVIVPVKATSSTCVASGSVTINIRPTPMILPGKLIRALVDVPYSSAFSTTLGTSPTFLIQQNGNNPLPPSLDFNGNVLTGTPTKAGLYNFNVVSTDPAQCSATATYTLRIEELAEPKLVVFPVYAIAGDPGFFIKPSNTLSDGALTYEIKANFTSSCVKLGPNGFVSNISCADSIPVTVKQAQTGRFKAGSVETYIKISPNPDTKLALTTTGVILTGGESQLKYSTNSNAPKTAIEFVQLNNPEIAEIRSDGTIIPYKTGTIDVEIRVPATAQYEAVTRTATITVYEVVQRPITVSDTIIIAVDQDTIINILANDQGVTRAIAPAKTDIDLDNSGVQNKYYSIGIGNFVIDLTGNLEFKPFSGFIGDGTIPYTVTDSAGVKSEPAYVYVKVIPLSVTPGLKANEVMTPNNDGANDGLVIAYANLDESNSLTVLDEAGNVVYETTNYQNDWRGTNKKGNAVEAGIYYYVYQEKVSGRGLQQYIQIVK